jgi:hypothetical protein
MEAERERERELMDNLFSSFETSFFFFLVFFHITGVRSQNKIISFGGLKRQYYYYYYYYYYYFFFFIIYLRGCPGKLPSEHVRHRGDDRRAHEDSNPGAAGGDKPLLPPGQDPQCEETILLIA